MSASAVCRLREHGADAKDANSAAVEPRVEPIVLCACENGRAVHEGPAPEPLLPPGGRQLSRVVARVSGPVQSFIPDFVGCGENLGQNWPFCGYQLGHMARIVTSTRLSAVL